MDDASDRSGTIGSCGFLASLPALFRLLTPAATHETS